MTDDTTAEFDFAALGFDYENNAAFIHELEKAETYFAAHPEECKFNKHLKTTRHSFIKYSDGRIVAVAHGKKPNGKKSTGLIGRGKFGYVKYAIDRELKIYALKRQKFHGREEKNEERIAIKRQLMLAPSVKRFSKEQRKKYYSLQHYMGPTLDLLLKKDGLSTQKKYSIARKLCSRGIQLHLQFTHGDIKPSNIAVNQEDEVNFIDHGFSNDITDNIHSDLYGTRIYHPYPLDQTIEDKNDPLYKSEMYLLRLTRTGKDLFAFIRTLYMPDCELTSSITRKEPSLFNQTEYQDLPAHLKSMLNTYESNIAHVIESIVEQKYESEITLTLAVSFVALELEININIETLSIQQKHEICVCMEYLDELGKKDKVAFDSFQALLKVILSQHDVETGLCDFRTQIEKKLEKSSADATPRFQPKKAKQPLKKNQNLSMAYDLLCKKNLLTEDNCGFIEEYISILFNLQYILKRLDHNHMLTQEHFDLVEKHIRAKTLSELPNHILALKKSIQLILEPLMSNYQPNNVIDFNAESPRTRTHKRPHAVAFMTKGLDRQAEPLKAHRAVTAPSRL